MPADLLADIRSAARDTGLSQADVVRQSVKAGLSQVRKRYVSAGRVTNVEPLPDRVLKRIYRRPERDEKGVERLTKAQATGGGRD